MQDCGKEKSNQPKDDSKKKAKAKKTFYVQVSCTCKRNCAQQIDVLRQKEIFDEYTKSNDWPSQTKFLRSLVSIQPVKSKLNPMIELKKRENNYEYHFINESGSLTRVCLSFFLRVLQINQSKVFRAVDSINKNPQAKENRGGAKSRRTDSSDLKNVKEFIHKFVSYDSSSKPQKSNIKCLHPRLKCLHPRN